MHHGGQDGQSDGESPHHGVTSGDVEEPPCHPRAQEASHLMAHEHHPIEHGEVLGPENLPHQSAGEGHRAQPDEPDGRGKQVDAEIGRGQQEENGDDQRTKQINQGEHPLFAEAVAQIAPDVRSDHVEDADQHQGVGAHHGSQSQVLRVGGQVGGQEKHMKAANEKSQVQQAVTRMAARLAQGGQHLLSAM